MRIGVTSLLGGTVAIAAAISAAIPLSHSFTLQMVLHMVLMDVIAPALVTADMTLHGLSARRRQFRQSISQWGRLIKFATAPAFAAVIHAAVMWGWHIPSIFAAAHTNTALQMTMSASFLAAGLMFWPGIISAGRHHQGIAIFWLFMSVMHTGFLGALLTFSRTPLYGHTLADQQLGGVTMWVFGTTVYGIAALCVTVHWLDALQRQTSRESRA